MDLLSETPQKDPNHLHMTQEAAFTGLILKVFALLPFYKKKIQEKQVCL